MKEYDSLFLRRRSPALGLLLILLFLAPTTLPARNLVENPGFESGLKGWGGPGTAWTIEATRESVHSGRQAARASKRTAPGQGLSQLIRSAPASGELYRYSAWVKIENANPYGNAASVFTQSGGVARYVAERASAGMIGVNIGVPVPREPFSFGGWNESKFGSGDITGKSSIEFFTKPKKTTAKWNPESKVNWMS